MGARSHEIKIISEIKKIRTKAKNVKGKIGTGIMFSCVYP
jgi:hypothetical protein